MQCSFECRRSVTFTPSLHDSVTRPKKGPDPEQKVKDIAGKVIGRVPANLCRIFYEFIENNQIKKVTCWSIASPTISKIPPVGQKYKRNIKGYDQRGGGAVIKCIYKVYCFSSSYNEVREKLCELFQNVEYEGTETLEEIKDSTDEEK